MKEELIVDKREIITLHDSQTGKIVDQSTLSENDLDKVGKTFYRFRKLLTFDDIRLDDFEILLQEFSAKELKYTQSTGSSDSATLLGAVSGDVTAIERHEYENMKLDDFRENHRINVKF